MNFKDANNKLIRLKRHIEWLESKCMRIQVRIKIYQKVADDIVKTLSEKLALNKKMLKSLDANSEIPAGMRLVRFELMAQLSIDIEALTNIENRVQVLIRTDINRLTKIKRKIQLVDKMMLDAKVMISKKYQEKVELSISDNYMRKKINLESQL